MNRRSRRFIGTRSLLSLDDIASPSVFGGIEREVNPLDQLLGLVRRQPQRGVSNNRAVAIDGLNVHADRDVVLR
jgi:hypothetical protein